MAQGIDADVPLVEATQKIVANIDWPCDVRRNYSEKNLGVKRRMYTGIDWVFEQFEQAILLEDDCLPDPTFFPYCTQLLEKYRNDDRIIMISGDNMLPRQRWNSDSYYFHRNAPHLGLGHLAPRLATLQRGHARLARRCAGRFPR